MKKTKQTNSGAAEYNEKNGEKMQQSRVDTINHKKEYVKLKTNHFKYPVSWRGKKMKQAYGIYGISS